MESSCMKRDERSCCIISCWLERRAAVLHGEQLQPTAETSHALSVSQRPHAQTIDHTQTITPAHVTHTHLNCPLEPELLLGGAGGGGQLPLSVLSLSFLCLSLPLPPNPARGLGELCTKLSQQDPSQSRKHISRIFGSQNASRGNVFSRLKICNANGCVLLTVE